MGRQRHKIQQIYIFYLDCGEGHLNSQISILGAVTWYIWFLSILFFFQPGNNKTTPRPDRNFKIYGILHVTLTKENIMYFSFDFFMWLLTELLITFQKSINFPFLTCCIFLMPVLNVYFFLNKTVEEREYKLILRLLSHSQSCFPASGLPKPFPPSLINLCNITSKPCTLTLLSNLRTNEPSD